MNTFEDVLDYMGFVPCIHNCKYSKAGKSFCCENEHLSAIYWFYETDNFIIDIHDFFIKKEFLIESFPDISSIIYISSSYVISGSGESLNPYSTLSSNSVYVYNPKSPSFKYILHSNHPYLSVGIYFKEKMFTDCLFDVPDIDFADVFFDTRQLITTALSKLAYSILNCDMDSPACELFFEAKAREWLSITLDAYISKKKPKPLSVTDEKALENVANYINDHYALDIAQELLEKISMMSGTKLKKLFKQKYDMSITEYSQRKRMNIAETLLLNSNMDIKDIAKSVGYSSHSKFSQYFKKYKGMYPKDIKKLSESYNSKHKCVCMATDIKTL